MEPKSPVFDDATHSFTIPEQDGVLYLFEGDEMPAGDWWTPGDVTVAIEAVADDGYTLTGTTSWTHTFLLADSPFIDVSNTQEHFASMLWMHDMGLATGWSTPNGQEYRPLAPVNRDAMAAFL